MKKLIPTVLATCLCMLSSYAAWSDGEAIMDHDSRVQESAKTTHSASTAKNQNQQSAKENQMEFGNFSVSLAVKDLKASKEFYEKLDFKQTFGSMEQRYLIMQNETSTIGLFQGMFEKNILTFNPGWDRNAKKLEKFQDVRDLQATLKERGIAPTTEAKPGDGPASFVIVDPDGNPILIDQHVPKPK